MEQTETILLPSWRDFLGEIAKLDALDGNFEDRHLSGLLFRGQPDASWELTTTLERYLKQQETDVFSYYNVLRAVAQHVGGATGRRWKLPLGFEYQRLWDGGRKFPKGSFPAYEFLAYARHHGFPSPLLDWSRSPYIAAYFAYTFTEVPESGNVAIFAFREYAGSTKISQSGVPEIRELGPYVQAHPRHFLQQSHYTVCWRRVGTSATYCRHEYVFQSTRRRQDLLRKYVLPASEASSVIAELDRFNLNAYSLFGTEEALLKTLAFRELLDLRNVSGAP